MALLALLALLALALEAPERLVTSQAAAQCDQVGAASCQAAGGGWLAAPPPPTQSEDLDSVRCRLSGICETPHPACAPLNGSAAAAQQGQQGREPPGPLTCLFDDASRAAAVQDAVRHAWSGYR